MKLQHKAKTPHEEGYEAYQKGIIKCPYDPLCAAGRAWDDGWWQAENEHDCKPENKQ